jgi:hypothetical protein
MRFTLEQLVLLACKLVDPAEDLLIVHNASLLRLPRIVVPQPAREAGDLPLKVRTSRSPRRERIQTR